MASASAAVVHPATTKYTCTASNPEICFSVITGSGYFYVEEDIHATGTYDWQAFVSGPGVVSNPQNVYVSNGWSGNLASNHVSGSPVSGGTYCGNYGSAPNACIVW
jgi:hypothetical protein